MIYVGLFRHTLLPIAGGFLLFFSLSCTSENALSGSLDQFYRLQHNLVRARLYRTQVEDGFSYSELSIEYVSSSTSAVPIRVTLRLGEGANEIDKIEVSHSYALAKYGDITGRLPDGTEVPRFRDGEITFDEYGPEMDTPIRGRFEASFPSTRDTLSLSGTFDAELELVTDPGPPRTLSR